MKIMLCDDSSELSRLLPHKNLNQTKIDEILYQNKDEYLIVIDPETQRLAPLKGLNKDGSVFKNEDYDDYTLYNLIRLNFNKKIFYVCPDYNIKNNFNELKKIVANEIKNDVTTLINPFMYTHEPYQTLKYTTESFKEISITKYEMKIYYVYGITAQRKEIFSKKFDAKYNVVSLNGTRKSHRLDLIRSLKDKNNFVYSYYPYEDVNQTKESYSLNRDLINELTEINEIYDEDITDIVSNKRLQDRSIDEIMKTMNSKWSAFQTSVPLEYIQSCVDLVTESYSSECVQITEKTFKPIIMKKPFIIFGARNSHEFLKKTGYELYDELFDYSFDVEDYSSRLSSIVSQISDILKMSTNDLKLFCEEKLKDKIEHNYNHTINKHQNWESKLNLNDHDYIEFLKEKQAPYD